MMARKVSNLPALIAIGGNPYLIEYEEHEAVRDGCNIYPELAPGWDGAPFVLDDVDDGETIEILGRRYQVNALTDLELVALALPGESEYEAESAAYDDHLSALGSHVEPPCTACNAANLVCAALEIINPDDCTISDIFQGDCGIVTFSVLSDDCGAYRARVTVEILTY